MDTPGEFIEAYTPPFYLGIDPGAEGALGFVSSCGQALGIDIPTKVVARKGGTTTVFRHDKIIEIFNEVDEWLYPASLLVCLEQALVQRRGKGANAYTGFRVGCAYSMWPLFLKSRGYPLIEVHPMTWKTEMKLLRLEKDEIRKMAIKLFPGAELKQKQDHDRAEALLLAQYRRMIDNGPLQSAGSEEDGNP